MKIPAETVCYRMPSALWRRRTWTRPADGNNCIGLRVPILRSLVARKSYNEHFPVHFEEVNV